MRDPFTSKGQQARFFAANVAVLVALWQITSSLCAGTNPTPPALLALGVSPFILCRTLLWRVWALGVIVLCLLLVIYNAEEAKTVLAALRAQVHHERLELRE